MEAGFWQFQRDVEEWQFWFKTRRRILDGLLRDAHLPRDARLLEIGCGAGVNCTVLERFGRVCALDREPDAFSVAWPGSGAGRVCGDAMHLPLRDGAFDAAVALDVIEHLDDDRAAATELARVLRPGGALVLFVPAFRLLWGVNDDLSHHRRRYRAPELRAVVEAAGLVVERLTYFNLFFFLPIAITRTAERWLRARRCRERELDRGLANSISEALFGLEVPWLARGRGLPFGVSIACVARRPR
jgi:SAM-dependent methyltransferase